MALNLVNKFLSWKACRAPKKQLSWNGSSTRRDQVGLWLNPTITFKYPANNLQRKTCNQILHCCPKSQICLQVGVSIVRRSVHRSRVFEFKSKNNPTCIIYIRPCFFRKPWNCCPLFQHQPRWSTMGKFAINCPNCTAAGLDLSFYASGKPKAVEG